MEKLSKALQALSEEDPTFRVRLDPETNQTVIAGMGELHLEIMVDRMMREFKVEANVGAAPSCLPRNYPQACSKQKANLFVKVVVKVNTVMW